ncbi:MAG: transcriptional regulator MarR family [Clostridia bacterium]|jgi:DNA-binding MarR family transcriptional regulator|nr:transcriptional regulator MarR family [Clostridia bacterium]
MDKEYIILHAIEQDPNITQRELSCKAQVSLGSVNLLINKMIKEGLIKMSQIPMNRAVYMLTPEGMAEKIHKTSRYIKYHYNYINEMKEKIREQLMKLVSEYDGVYVVLEGDELSEVVKLAVHDIKGVRCIESKDSETGWEAKVEREYLGKKVVVVLSEKACEKLGGVEEVVWLLERI